MQPTPTKRKVLMVVPMEADIEVAIVQQKAKTTDIHHPASCVKCEQRWCCIGQRHA